jgi:hypothetical protein
MLVSPWVKATAATRGVESKPASGGVRLARSEVRIRLQSFAILVLAALNWHRNTDESRRECFVFWDHAKALCLERLLPQDMRFP